MSICWKGERSETSCSPVNVYANPGTICSPNSVTESGSRDHAAPHLSHLHRLRCEVLLEHLEAGVEVHVRPAREHVNRSVVVLRPRMDRDVRLRDDADAGVAPVGERDEPRIQKGSSTSPNRFHECFLADLGLIEVICFPKLDQKMAPQRVHPVTPSIKRPPRSRS